MLCSATVAAQSWNKLNDFARRAGKKRAAGRPSCPGRAAWPATSAAGDPVAGGLGSAAAARIRADAVSPHALPALPAGCPIRVAAVRNDRIGDDYRRRPRPRLPGGACSTGSAGPECWPSSWARSAWWTFRSARLWASTRSGCCCPPNRTRSTAASRRLPEAARPHGTCTSRCDLPVRCRVRICPLQRVLSLAPEV